MIVIDTSAGSAYRAVDMAPYSNNVGISAAGHTSRGAFNVWGNSFPAEHLPESGAPVSVGGVPFRFPRVGVGDDNVRCDGQFIAVEAGRFDWLHLLTASERRAEDAVEMHFADGSVDPEWLRVSDFWAAPAWFGETTAFATPTMHYPHHVQRGVSAMLWSQRVPVTRRADLSGFRLPRNAAVHVFAATLQRTAVPEAGHDQ
ncbi:hypothetical protein SAMN05216489_01102 [Streptomyces sp. 3213]|uniref:hypothetical protein n=1 Tax=Streptomyces sp. 3213.3 TaxID=1855348 RepID=UPI00089C4C8C|nr:hypothetical protein [Streptomyces sp. 3213.3]SEC58513.1 hypothetical protein SAMN05216489_01102 [Streptomyces sp. 3213] [Streptomyces sp. 3213.3]